MLCSLRKLRARMKMSNFERKYSPGYRHVICIGKTKSKSQNCLLGILLGAVYMEVGRS